MDEETDEETVEETDEESTLENEEIKTKNISELGSEKSAAQKKK